MKSDAIKVGQRVLVDGNIVAIVTAIRGSWIEVQEFGTRRRDEYQASRVVRAPMSTAR
ncbi:MAG TPA: hypothetical protein PLT35_13280 [Vicinamibacterales bacterium]|nr:hypothetical protein [Vicinamibacterales bacterium]